MCNYLLRCWKIYCVICCKRFRWYLVFGLLIFFFFLKMFLMFWVGWLVSKYICNFIGNNVMVMKKLLFWVWLFVLCCWIRYNVFFVSIWNTLIYVFGGWMFLICCRVIYFYFVWNGDVVVVKLCCGWCYLVKVFFSMMWFR